MMAKRALDYRELDMVSGGSWWGDIVEAVGKEIETQSKIATTVVETITGVESIKEAPEIYQEISKAYTKKVG